MRDNTTHTTGAQDPFARKRLSFRIRRAFQAIGFFFMALLLAVAGFAVGLVLAPLLAVALPFCFAWDYSANVLRALARRRAISDMSVHPAILRADRSGDADLGDLA